MSAFALRGPKFRQDDSRLALAALVFGALVIGTTPILVRLAACGPAAAGFWRLAFATPLLALMAAGRPGVAIGGPSRAIGLAGIFFALDLACWHYGIRYTSVANATVLPNLTPVLVTLASWVFFKERPRPIFLVGLVAAVSGAVLMAGAASATANPGPLPHIGDALSVSTAVWYGLYFMSVRAARLSRSTLSVMLWAGVVGAPPLLLTAVLMREQVLPATALGARPAARFDRFGDGAGPARDRRRPGLHDLQRGADAAADGRRNAGPARRGRGPAGPVANGQAGSAIARAMIASTTSLLALA
jgi:drug/metabolite transporter (DMT)-like permease